MKICIECLECRDSWMSFCPNCGKKLFHTGTVETEHAEKRLVEKGKYHCDGCQAIGFKKEQVGNRHCDYGMVVGPKPPPKPPKNVRA